MFDIPLPNVGAWVNTRLLSEPLNWAIVFIVATIWLMAFHVVMTAFSAMQTTKTTAFATAPGQVTAQSPSGAMFSTPGLLAGGATQVPGLFEGGGPAVWTDSSENRISEDGWFGNP
jgi:hypothetical protein